MKHYPSFNYKFKIFSQNAIGVLKAAIHLCRGIYSDKNDECNNLQGLIQDFWKGVHMYKGLGSLC